MPDYWEPRDLPLELLIETSVYSIREDQPCFNCGMAFPSVTG